MCRIYHYFKIRQQSKFTLRPVFYLFVLVSIFACGKGSEGTGQSKMQKTLLDSMAVTERVFDSEISYSDSGYLRAVIKAPLIEQHGNASKPFIELPKGLKAYFYNANKEVESQLTAGFGINYLNSKIVEVRKQVEVVNTKNEKLKTEKLFWDQNKKEIYTEDNVEIITETEQLFGKGMRASQDFSAWTITKVTGTVKLK